MGYSVTSGGARKAARPRAEPRGRDCYSSSSGSARGRTAIKAPPSSPTAVNLFAAWYGLFGNIEELNPSINVEILILKEEQAISFSFGVNCAMQIPVPIPHPTTPACAGVFLARVYVRKVEPR